MSERFACPCCGYLTLDAASPGSWLTCPVCAWTDKVTAEPAAMDELIEAQRTFARIGASSPGWLDQVRPPTTDEARTTGWGPPAVSPRERERDELLARIEKAFADVTPEGRITLRQSYRGDYHGEPDIDWDDDDRRWQDIPSYVLDYFGRGTTAFVFGNAEGFRYYLPAFMRHSLRGRHASPAVEALGRPEGAEAGFSDEQRAVIRDFLRHVVTYDAPAPWAERALERSWP